MGLSKHRHIEKIFTKTLRQLGLSPAQKLDEIVPTSREVQHIELKELGNKVKEIHDVIDKELPMRELLGLDKALQRIEGEIINGTSKLSEIEKHIAKEHKKLGEADTDHQRKRIKERFEQLKEEYDVRLESLSQIKEKLSS